MPVIHQGKILHNLLKEKKVSIKVFANYMGVSRQSIHSMINNAVLSKANLCLVVTLLGVDPQDFDLKESYFKSNLSKTNFTTKVCFKRVNFVGKSFKRLDFSKATFEDSNFENVDFEEANLKGAKFINCNLRNSNMSFANIDETDFTRSDLTGTNLKEIKNWKNCKVYKTNIDRVINEPPEFKDWAQIEQAALNWKNWKERKDIEDTVL